MKLHNNYIFLRKKTKSNVKRNGKNEYEMKIEPGFFYILNNCFKISSNEWKEELRSFNNTIDFSIEEIKIANKIKLEVYNISSKVFMNIFVECENEDQVISTLNYIEEKLRSAFNKAYYLITSYDTVSEYYCNKIYDKLAHFERTFRRLLFNVYILNFGEEYYEKTIDTTIVDKAKKNIREKNVRKEEAWLQNFFYSLDYGDIVNILFDVHWTDADRDRIDMFLSENSTLNLLSDGELRTFIEDIKPKSDWERLFCNNTSIENVKDNIVNISKVRNVVAHSKFLKKEDYECACKLIEDTLVIIEEAINNTQQKDFLNKYNEERFNEMVSINKALKMASERINEITQPFKDHLNEIGFSSMCKALNNMFYGTNINKEENEE